MASEPQRFGKYDLLSRIAAGGMAEIFFARATSIKGFEKYLVIKRILPAKSHDQHFIAMFLDEARLAATLDHPNIVQIHDVGAIDGEYFIAMEYLHGEDLLELVRAGVRKGIRKPPLEVVLTTLSGALAGLHYAHERRAFDGRPLAIVHRDVTPGNIVITFDGAVKLVDFGIAKAAGRSVDGDTRSGALKGKLQYMSPEQCKGEEVDRRSDLFAVGILLYELSTGRRLYHEKSDFETLKKVVEGPVPDPALVSPGYPERLRAIVLRALAKAPADRYPTARDMQADLDDYARDNKLVIGTVALAEYCEKVFPEKMAAWRAAEAAGKPMAERLAAGQGDGGYLGESRRRANDVSYAEVSRRHQQKRIAQITLLVLLAGTGAALVWRVASPSPATMVRVASPPAVAISPPLAVPAVHAAPSAVSAVATTPLAGPPRSAPPARDVKSHSPHAIPPPLAVAHVTLAADPWCEVLIDGKPFGQTPLVDLELAAGSHTLTFLNSGANVHEDVRIRLSGGETFKKKYVFPQ